MGEISNPSVRGQLNSLTQRVENVEKRLEELEEVSRPISKAKELRRKNSSPPQEDSAPNHNYLRRAISDAKRRYEKEYQV